MDRDCFARRLREAAAAARDFARTFIEEQLPDAMRFRIRLNRSYDANAPVGDEILFPGDSSHQRARDLRDCSDEDAIDALWRRGRVPEWIDVSVIGETGTSSLIQLLCCGRFTADDTLLYHLREGRPPFHVTGPALPASWELGRTGGRFSIYDRTECWTLDDVERLRSHADKVWLLELQGSVFNDELLQALPSLPRLEILQLTHSPLRGEGLSGLERHPKLRVLRIGLDGSGAFLISKAPDLSRIEAVTVQDPPPGPWGSAEFLRGLPNISWLTLQADGELFIDGVCPAKVSRLSLTATKLGGTFRLPRTIASVFLHLSEATEPDVEALLADVGDVEGIDLSGTGVGDAFAEGLPHRFRLSYLNLVRTQVSEPAVARIRAAHPQMKLLPNRR